MRVSFPLQFSKKNKTYGDMGNWFLSLNLEANDKCFKKVIIIVIQTTQKERLFRLQRGKPFSSCHPLHVFLSSLSWYLDTRSLTVCHLLNGQTTRHSHKRAWGPSSSLSVLHRPCIPFEKKPQKWKNGLSGNIVRINLFLARATIQIWKSRQTA